MLTKLNLLALILFYSISLWADINQGLWSTGCKNGLKKEQIYDNRNKVITVERYFTDANCMAESFNFQTTGQISYYKDSADFIDFVYAKIYLNIFKQNIIEDFNTRKVCGISNWKAAYEQNITGLKCAIFNISRPTQIPATGDLKFGIYRIEQNKLYYGLLSKDFDASTPAKRPVQINSLIEYIFRN